jgi:hypothetical protein
MVPHRAWSVSYGVFMFGRRFFLGISIGTCAALVVAGAGIAQGASVPPWRIVQRVGPAGDGANMMGVDAIGGSHAWAVGMAVCGPNCPADDLAVEQWNGRSWTTMSIPVSLGYAQYATYPPAIGATAATNVWAFTEGGPAYADHWNGKKWTASVVPGAAFVSATYVASTRDIWAFGGAQEISGYAAEYNGSKWVSHAPPVDILHSNQVSAVSANDIWVAGASGTSLLPSTIETAHWTGTKWQAISLAGLHLAKNTALDPFGVGIYAAASNNVWIASDLLGDAEQQPIPGGVLGHWNGKTWTSVKVPTTIYASGAVTSDGHGGVWLAATLNAAGTKTVVEHYSAGKWSYQVVTPPAGYTLAINALESIPGTQSVWGVGSITKSMGNGETQGVILKYGA